MKNTVYRFSLWFALALTVGCGASSTTGTSGYNPYCPAGYCSTSYTGTSPLPAFTTGDTETFTLANTQVLNEYAGSAIGSPTNMQVNISLAQENANDGTPIYLGTLTIRYLDASYNIYHNGEFSNGNASDSYRSYTNNVSKQTSSGNYRIFFEDPAGALVLTITSSSGTDTTTAGTSTGQIWFENFNSTAPNPLIQGYYDGSTYYNPGLVWCWMIDLGPYDCRNFNVPPSGQYQDGDQTVPGFTLLGTVPSINLTTALGITN